MNIRRLRPAALVLGAAVLLAGVAGHGLFAQVGPGPAGRAPYSAQPGPRNEAGRFDYYSLVLSWSPTYCAGLKRDGYDPQCHARNGKRYAFVLHGLWPQHERGWPENCRTQARPFVPQKTIDSMLDIMPSSKLVIHEYRKHGTCSGLTPEDYYKVSRQLYDKVKIPPRYRNPNAAFTVSPAEVVRDFTSVNPTLKAENMAVACGGPGDRMREVRVCFSREGTFRPCGQNENARRLCRASKMFVPPVRSGASDAGPGRRI